MAKKDSVLWSTTNEALGGWQECDDLPGRKMSVYPDMDKERWYWAVVWSAVKGKYDNKKGVTINGLPSRTAWGIAPTRIEAKEKALARAERPRPRIKKEHEMEEGTLFDG